MVPGRAAAHRLRECAIAFVLLLVFMFFGRHFLAALQLSECRCASAAA
jgi:small neutral amino acid transporter SnatA (MarC family)